MIFHEGYLAKEQVSQGRNYRYQIGEISNEMTLVSGNITRIIHLKNIKNFHSIIFYENLLLVYILTALS